MHRVYIQQRVILDPLYIERSDSSIYTKTVIEYIYIQTEMVLLNRLARI